MRIIFFQIFLNILFSSCYQHSETADIKIKPLHPYSASPFYYKQNETKDRNYIIKYFFIEGASKATDELSKEVDSFITEYIKRDSDFVDFGDYYLKFYRKTKIINENFREQIDGMISHNLLSEYDDDLLFTYVWYDKDFMGCQYYKDGKIVKTIYDKEGDILKRNSALPLPDTGKVKIEEVF